LQPTCAVATGTITVSSDVTDLTFSIDGSTYTNTTGVFTSVDPGVYEVTAMNSDGCVSEGASVTLTECTIGISPYNKGDAIEAVSIYPNPFRTSLYIMVNDVSQMNNSELKIYNALGDEVMVTKLMNKLTSIETNKLPVGVYFYRVIDNGLMIQSGILISQ
jgi:hypothetical protein